MKWFRFYSEVLHDSKVQTLPPEMFRYWVNLLCLANEGATRGTLPAVKQIAFVLHVKEDKARSVVEQFIAEGLLDRDENGELSPHNWRKRQHNSDDVSNRVREYRKRKAVGNVTANETLHGTTRIDTRNVTETPRVRADTDSETDSEEENTPLPPIGGSVCVRFIEPDEEPEPFQAPLKPDPPGITGPGSGSREAIALEAWAKSLGCDRDHESYAYWAKQTCDYAPAEWIKELLKHNVQGRSNGKRAAIPVLGKIIGDWLAEKRCPYIRSPAPTKTTPASNIATASPSLRQKLDAQTRRPK